MKKMLEKPPKNHQIKQLFKKLGLGEVWDIVGSPEAAKAARLWDLDLSAVWPMGELRMFTDGKIARWLEHRFPDSRPA